MIILTIYATVGIFFREISLICALVDGSWKSILATTGVVSAVNLLRLSLSHECVLNKRYREMFFRGNLIFINYGVILTSKLSGVYQKYINLMSCHGRFMISTNRTVPLKS